MPRPFEAHQSGTETPVEPGSQTSSVLCTRSRWRSDRGSNPPLLHVPVFKAGLARCQSSLHGEPSGIRTHNSVCLRHSPLPVGIPVHGQGLHSLTRVLRLQFILTRRWPGLRMFHGRYASRQLRSGSHLKGDTPGLARENRHTLSCGIRFGSLLQHGRSQPDFAVLGSASSLTLTLAIMAFRVDGGKRWS